MGDTIKAMTEAVRGRVITPLDSEYDAARLVCNGMHDRKPRAVIQCMDAADVMAVVAAARDGGFNLAIRGGGHSVPGFGTVDGGLVIDLSPMKNVWVDPNKKVVRVGGGATWGDVDHATYPFGLAAPGGIISTTGVGGLTLGGGIGYLTRGLGCPSTTCCQPMLCSPMAGRSRRAITRTKTCSGRCAAAAVTSVSSPASSFSQNIAPAKRS